MKESIKRFLFGLFHPSFWIMNYQYSEAWDAKLNDLMKSEKFIPISSCTAKLGKLTLWVSNYPYACMTVDNKWDLRPSRLTIKRAYDKYIRECIESVEEE